MSTVRCYIGLGSNLGDPLANLHSAIAHLAASSGITLCGVSRFYISKPMGPQDQPDYMNAVVALDTTLDAHALLEVLFCVERAHGRVRDTASRWGARTLDLDLLLYGNVTIADATLCIPHPGICERSFVVLPLLELMPHGVLPNGKTLKACRETLACDDLRPLGQELEAGNT